jgi:hypothetical protein
VGETCATPYTKGALNNVSKVNNLNFMVVYDLSYYFAKIMINS